MNLLKRISVALIGIPLLLYVFYLNGTPLLIFGSLLSALISLEMFKMFKQKGLNPNVLTVPFSVITFLTISLYGWSFAPISLFPFLCILFINRLLRNDIEGSIISIAISLFTVFYAGVLPSSIITLGKFSNGNYLLILIIILTWITDSFAYFIGMTLGKHRGIFPVSPQKSVEGFVAGLVFAVIAAIATYFIFPNMFTMTQLVSAGISTGIAGQAGDLMESLIKRDMGVKDSSNLIPGHGGVLDRFDSFLISISILYVVLTIETLI